MIPGLLVDDGSAARAPVRADPGAPARRLLVVGAGWSGLAAAVQAAQRGWQVCVADAAPQAGGRARNLRWDLPDGAQLTLDNGQHLLIGAYSATLALRRTLGLPDLPSLPFHWCDDQHRSLIAPVPPAPLPQALGLAIGLLTARGWTLAERWSLIRLSLHARLQGWRAQPGETVDALLQRMGQPASLQASFWRPLCVSALNTPSMLACAQTFLNVLRDSVGAGAQASAYLLPQQPLGDVLPEPAVRWLQQHGHEVRLGCLVDGIKRVADVWMVATRGLPPESYDAVILATGPQAAAPLLAQVGRAETAQQAWQMLPEPITTVWFAAPETATARNIEHNSYDTTPNGTPAKPDHQRPFLMLTADPERRHYAQVLCYRGLVDATQPVQPEQTANLDACRAARYHVWAAIISADGPHRLLDRQDLTTAVLQQVRQHLDLASQSSPVHALTVVEKRATFRCTPNLSRPTSDQALPGLALAGDYVMGPYPATLESAVRHGLAAVDVLSRHFSEARV